MKKSRTLYLGIISFVMALSLACGIITNPTFKASASSSDSYVELYSPASGREVTMQNPTYLNAVVENHSDTESGKALALDYKAGHSGSVNVAIPTSAKPNEDFKGIAFWVDVPETIDEYSFTLFLVKDDAVWQVMEMGTPLTLISHDGKVTEVSSIWKRFQLSGFKGWVMIPKEAFPDPAPETGKQYKFIFMMEDAASEGAKRTSDMKMYVGSIGYYTDVTGFMFEKAGEKAMSQNVIKEIEGYISDIELLKPKSNAQITLKNKMLVYFTNLKENFNLLTAKEKIEISNNLYNDYYDYMEDYLYGDIRKTELLMTFATMSDTHFTNTWVNERFLKALEDAKTISPDLSGVFVLGDLSNEGVSPSTPALTELDNYYDWLDGFEYLNSKGEQIPIRNVMGNHDVRGPSTEPGGSYPQGAYAPAVQMYLEREGVDTLQWDTWINGYHFIFLNTDKYHSDDAYLSAQTIDWLDETLAENDNGQPEFVLIHQPLDRIHVMEGAKYTFEEVIARHTNTIVLSGHNHSDFGNARIIDEGNGYFVNQPAMVNLSAQYYLIEIYEGGVILRAREASTGTWVISSDVVVANENRFNNGIFSANSIDESQIVASNTTATIEKANSISGKYLKAVALQNGASVTVPAYELGKVENYAGYAVYMDSDSEVSLSFDNVALKAGATYYAIENSATATKTVSESGKVSANGWIIIPKESIDGSACPSKTLTVTIGLEEGQTAYIDQISYYFDMQDFVSAVTVPAYSFFSDGSLIVSGTLSYGSELVAPANPQKAATDAYDYNFVGWDLDGDGVKDDLPAIIKGDINAHAVFDAVIKQYTYSFVDSNGTDVLKTATVDYGTAITAPAVDGLLGWDLDGDGAIENLPDKVTKNFTATAVLGIPPYENATVVFDPAELERVDITTSAWSAGPSTILVSTLPMANNDAPSGKVAQFTHPGDQTAGMWPVYIKTPYSGTIENLQGFAIWISISATEEEYVGGININSTRPSDYHYWTMIESNGTITEKVTKYTDYGMNIGLGKGFTGWILIDKTSWNENDQSVITPSASGDLQFRFLGGNRTTPVTISIGQILVYSDKAAMISDLTGQKSVIDYTFSDGNGHIYKAGQVGANESIIVPEDPVHENPDMFFAGWDTNGDGDPDDLPQDGKISKKLEAVALFYHVSAFETVNDGSIKGWAQQESSITVSSVDYADSPTGKAIKVVKKLHETQTAYAKYTLPAGRQPKGIALWLDASSTNGFGMQLFKNWKPKQTVAEGGDYVYFYGEDGSLTSFAGWRATKVPANFKGWMIFSMDVFTDAKDIVTGDYLRFGVDSNEDSNVNFEGTFYFGEVIYFDCDEQTFMKQITKRVYGFKDYDGSFVSCGMANEGDALVVPEDPTRDGWRFVGWDADGDGLADEIPATYNRTFKATAVYTKELTYRFVTEEGDLILERTAEYNSLILPPFRYLENDPNFTYNLTYVDYVEGMRLTDNVEFTVIVEKTGAKTYDYAFKVEGVTFASGSLEYGAVINAPSGTPTKEASEHATYVFAGWEGYTEGMVISEDVTFNALFTTVPNIYTVTFYAKDGTTVISSEELEYGSVIQLPQAPEVEGYTFKGWNGYIEGMTISGDVEFVAEYEKIKEDNSSSVSSGNSSKPTSNCKTSMDGSIVLFLAIACVAIVAVKKGKQD